MRKIALLLALCLMLTALTGCGGDDVREQTYTLNCGVTITAGAGLREISDSSDSGELEEDRYSIFFTNVSGTAGMSEDEFVDYLTELLEDEGYKAKFKQDSQGNLKYTYTQNVDGVDYFYYMTLHSGAGGWWLCEMCCREAMKPLYEDRFARWSATVLVPGQSTGDVGSGSTGDYELERYELDNGATLTAVEGLEVYSIGERDYALENRDLIMILVEENKQAYGLEDMTLYEYGDLLMTSSGLEARYADDSYGNVAAGYYTELDGDEYYCYGVIRETNTSFWYFDIYCAADAMERYQADLPLWCGSLTLEDTPMFSAEQTRYYELECGAGLTAMAGLTEDNDGLDEGNSYLYGSGLHIGVVWLGRQEHDLEGVSREELGASFEADGDSGSFAVDSYGSYASEYYDESDGSEYYNYMTIVEEDDGFWVVMMYCLASNESVYADYMPQWAATVSSIE